MSVAHKAARVDAFVRGFTNSPWTRSAREKRRAVPSRGSPPRTLKHLRLRNKQSIASGRRASPPAARTRRRPEELALIVLIDLRPTPGRGRRRAAPVARSKPDRTPERCSRGLRRAPLRLRLALVAIGVVETRFAYWFSKHVKSPTGSLITSEPSKERARPTYVPNIQG